MSNFKRQNIPFTQVANEVLNDKTLSAKAKGLYAYLYSKPEGWNFSMHRIINDMADGRDSIANGLKELEDNKYLVRERLSNGRMDYKLSLIRKKPDTEKPTVGKTHSGKTRTVSNKELIVIKSNTNKEIQVTEIPSFIDSKLWNEWITYRKEIKQPLTPRSMKMQLALLTENKDQANQMLTKSMTNGWKGLFPDKGKQNKQITIIGNESDL